MKLQLTIDDAALRKWAYVGNVDIESALVYGVFALVYEAYMKDNNLASNVVLATDTFEAMKNSVFDSIEIKNTEF